MRLGTWQREILAQVQRYGTVAWSEVQPRGKARQYAGRYQRSFLRLAELPGIEAGAYGPRGGLALRYTV